MQHTPPRFAHWLLTKLHPEETLEEVEGDLDELYTYWYHRAGRTQATLRYVLNVVSVLPPFVQKRRRKREYDYKPSTLIPAMFRSYSKIAWRTIRKNKVSTLINVAGLTLGLICGLLITAFVLDELAYDRFHQNADRIVLFQQFENSSSSGGKFATDLKSRFASVADAVRLTRIKPLVTHEQTAFYEPNFWFADSSVFRVFTLPLVSGNPQTALTEQYGVVLSETMARKYFGKTNPLGKRLQLNNKATLHVTGVFRNLPAQSHQKIDFLAPYANANELVGYDVTTNYWGGGETWTYLLLAPGAVAADLSAQLPAYIKQLGDPNSAVWKPALVALTDIYLRTNLVATNRLTYVYVFTLVALLILGLAVFNYVNLSTARATKRAKEVGIRKALGSSFGQLWRQFLSETIGLLVVAVLIAVLLADWLMPAFNQLADKQLTLSMLFTPAHLAVLILCLGGVTLLAGGYPAFVLSSFRPVAILKGNRTSASGRSWLRQTLVVGQFAVSVSMIVATLVVYSQLEYVRTKDVGYQREQILTLDLGDASNEAKALFRQQLTALPGVEAATRAGGLPGTGWVMGAKLVSEYVPKGAQSASINRLTVDGDYLKTFRIKLIEGRNLNPDRPADKGAFLINRAAMQYFGWKNSMGKRTGYYTYAYDPAKPGAYREVPQVGDVVGVVEDYNYANLKQTVAPLLISLNDGWEGQLAVRLRRGNLPATIRQIQQVWQGQFPGKPFAYAFLDDTFNRTYQAEARTGQVFGLFAMIAVLISCLGLFGLATFTAEQRTKEIGVRKVMGASVASIVTLLNQDFLKLVLIAIGIASPLAYYAMSQWLQDFAYKIDISWWIFALAGLIAISIALLTVSFQSIRAALVNPIRSLRSE
jgi:putative ABC transport system permease protein